MDIPEPEILIEQSANRFYRDDAVRWVWIFYGLAQATVTMLMAFGVIEGTTVAAIVTAVALIIYVGVNEVFVRPYRSRTGPTKVKVFENNELTPVVHSDTQGTGSTLPPANSTP